MPSDSRSKSQPLLTLLESTVSGDGRTFEQGDAVNFVREGKNGWTLIATRDGLQHWVPSTSVTPKSPRLPPAAEMQGDSQSTIAKYFLLKKHPELFSPWQSDAFDPKFLELVARIKEGIALDELLERDLLHKEVDDVYSFPMLSIEFCERFLEEMDNYFASGLPIKRPNSMNNYGLVVNKIGLEPSITHLQQNYILPVAKLLYPKQGAAFDSHHSFMVEYKAGHDLGLDMHTDDSDVTLNVCLGREFTGAGLTFCGSMGQPDYRRFSTQYSHKRGYAVIHLGTKRHGADDITSGQRNNLIIWNHNYKYRDTEDYQQAAYFQEEAPPDLRCLSYTHDRDYEALIRERQRQRERKREREGERERSGQC